MSVLEICPVFTIPVVVETPVTSRVPPMAVFPEKFTFPTTSKERPEVTLDFPIATTYDVSLGYKLLASRVQYDRLS